MTPSAPPSPQRTIDTGILITTDQPLANETSRTIPAEDEYELGPPQNTYDFLIDKHRGISKISSV